MNLRHLACGLGLLLGLGLLAGCTKAPPPGKGDSGPPVVTVAHPRVEKVTRYSDLTGQTDAVESVEVRRG